MPTFTPTDEQLHILDLARTGGTVAVTAGAGAAKTTTCRMITEDRPDQSFWLAAFNKAIAQDAKGKFPANATCSTIHSRAWLGVVRGTPYADRLNAPRVASRDIAKQLRITHIDVDIARVRRRITDAKLAGLVMRGLQRFYQSDAPEPVAEHIPNLLDKCPPGLHHEYRAINARIRSHLAPYLAKAWADIQNPNGKLPFSHDAYQALWVLSRPRVNVDTVLLDEAQDSSARVVQLMRQLHESGTQVLVVGDRNQRIYEWRGAVDGFELFGCEHEATLSTSFRFGPEIAEVANEVLGHLGDFRITGAADPGEVWREYRLDVDAPPVTLARTNAVCVEGALLAIDNGLRVRLVGGADDVIDFAKASLDLRDHGRTEHPDLQWATSWAEVVDYASNDELGADLARLVGLIQRFGAGPLIGRLRAVSDNPKAKADVVFSTAHKSKGLEFPAVRLADDFPDAEKAQGEELRLLYVAATRAMRLLDVSVCPWFVPTIVDADEEPEAGEDGQQQLFGEVA